jgi:hypothetical protein
VDDKLVNLPDPEPSRLIIVERMVAEAASHRNDLVFPDDLVRDENGVVESCRRLSRIGDSAIAGVKNLTLP